MKLQQYQMSDISAMTSLPKTTVRDRFKKLNIEPVEKIFIGGVKKYYYSESQVLAFKGHCNHFKNEEHYLKTQADIDEKYITMTLPSKINFNL